MDFKKLGLVISLVAAAMFLYGGMLYVTGKADDGNYTVRKGESPLGMMARNSSEVERRRQAKTPLTIGGIGLAIGVGLLISAKPSTTNTQVP